MSLPFHPAVSAWFDAALGAPTPAQVRGWDAIRQGRHTLIAAPTGSGKTLAAFLNAIDALFREGLDGALPDEVRVVYVSPLKALSADIHKNLAEPRAGIRRVAREMGLDGPRITAAVRTGDTPSAERAAMLRTPPHILVTTPESLYLLLTAARGRDMLRTARTVIVDEIHAVVGTRRGAHLALSLERLSRLTGQPPLRLGLSATQKPLDEVARFLVGGAPGADAAPDCVIVDEGHRRATDLAIELPASPLEAVMAHEVWEEYYDRLADLIRAHRTTLVFVNTRRLAERVARHLTERLGDEAVTAHHGSLSKERRLDGETRLKSGRLRALVATASLELGIDIGHVDLVCQIGSPRRIATLLQRVGRSGHTVLGTSKGRLFPTSRDDLVECAALLREARHGGLDRVQVYDAPLDVLAQQVVAETACEEHAEDDLFALVRRAHPYRALPREQFDRVVGMLAEGFNTRRGRRGALVHRDEVHRRLRGRRAARMTAITSGGAIPDNADYRVVLDPGDVFLGTLNEDFAIESMAGDVFQLGNTSWRILQVAAGTVRVQDARGAPPNIPFWLGEAPGRSDELSEAVSDLRSEMDRRLAEADRDGTPAPLAATAWLAADAGVSQAAAEQIAAYFVEARRALGLLPTHQTIVLERFFDESGGMQLVLHAPFGSRLNRAWGLALRKRFCRQFNFELQAAATDDALLLSLGPQHSFPLADVFRYLQPATVRDVLVQALLDAPMFQTRWRWNTTIALAVPRSRGGRKVPPPLQRMQADDLLAAVFPDAAACLENIPGDRQIPDHPLVSQTVRDCLHEAMDISRLERVLADIRDGRLACVSRDTTEPSPLAHEILNARPYAFLDDAPLEERRAQAVYTRRATEPGGAGLGVLDGEAIARVRSEAWPDPRDADELHDALLTAGFLTEEEGSGWSTLLGELCRSRRATRMVVGHADSSGSTRTVLWAAAERLPELLALYRAADGHTFSPVALDPPVAAPDSRSSRGWTADAALVELLRGRLSIDGPTTAGRLSSVLAVRPGTVEAALVALEAEGVVLRGSFTPAAWPRAAAEDPDPSGVEWCDRTLLARIHRYTLNRLRAEIEPVSPADYMRFLFGWQHADPAHRAAGLDGLRAVLTRLDGFEAPAGAWERHLLPARVEGYEPSMLDMLCLTGEVGWARLTPRDRTPSAGSATTVPALVRSTPIALYLREHGRAWRRQASQGAGHGDRRSGLSERAREVLAALERRGASFARDLSVPGALPPDAVQQGLAELVSAGLAASDGFSGVRALLSSRGERRGPALDRAGRWSVVAEPEAAPNDTGSPSAAVAAKLDDERAIEEQARVLLRRYGVVCRRLLTREASVATWRELALAYRRLEARGEIRGGRFVTGMSGEQFALPEAVAELRAVRRTPGDGRLVAISAADPLNLAGIATAGDRVPAIAGNRVVYRDGVPLAAQEGDYVRPLAEYSPDVAEAVTRALTGRALPAVARGFVGRGA